MRKIILSINITLDDFIAGSDGSLNWHFPYWNFEMCDALGRLLNNCDTILLGKNTYTALAGYWAAKGADLNISREDIALVGMMNQYTKMVVSKSLTTLNWENSFLVQGNILREIKKLKEEQGKDIIVLGSTRLVSYLLNYDLIDEYYLWVHPIVIKRGKSLPKLIKYLTRAILIHSEEFSSGVIKLNYDSHQRVFAPS